MTATVRADDPERLLTRRVLAALHREDVLGLRTGAALEQRPDGAWLRGGRLALPVAEDGYQSRWTARRPLLEVDGRPLTALDDVLAAVAGAPLRAALLDAEELPVKAMVTAGTLLSKERSGAADINKHYTTGPNYLLWGGGPV